MKKLRLIFAAAAISAAMGAQAQSDPKAAIAALDTIIRKHANYKNVVDPFVETVYGKFRKHPDVATAIAKAYYKFYRPAGQPYYTYVTRDSANAYKYINFAIEEEPGYVPAYVFGGDIQVTMGDTLAALDWYRRAIAADKANPAGYIAYADLQLDRDSVAAVTTLMGLRDYRPGYPVELAMGRMFMRRANVRSAEEIDAARNAQTKLNLYRTVDALDAAERDSMTIDDLRTYSMYHYLLGNYDKSLDVALYGHGRKERDAAFNRLAFWSYTNLAKFDEALAFADLLFNKSDSAVLDPQDYFYYGIVYSGKKRYDEAIAMFGEVVAHEKAAEKMKATAQDQIINAYKQKGDFDTAIARFKANMAAHERDSTISAYDYYQLGGIYIEYANSLKGDTALAVWQKADSVYAVMADKYPANADYPLYMRLQISNVFDPESEQGLGVPFAEKLIAFIQAQGTNDKAAQEKLLMAYRYLGYYYTFVLERRARGRVYWQKILEIDPENAAAKQVLGLG